MKRITQYGAVIGAVVVLLSGCSEGTADPVTPTQPPADTGTPPQANNPPQVNNTPQANNPPQVKVVTESAAADSRKASANLPEIGRVTAAVRQSNDSVPGTLTAIMRSVEVEGQIMTIKFAVQWGNSGASESAKPSAWSLGWRVRDLVVVDTMNLTAYRPLCTSGFYKNNATNHNCYNSQLRWPSNDGGDLNLLNHVLTEGSAILPAPEGRPATLEINLGSPLPVFTAVPVTYR